MDAERDLDPAPRPPPPAVRPDESLDQMWTTLKESRAYLALAEEHLVECAAAAERARTALELARAERDTAAERMKTLKADLDRAFETAQ